MAVVCSAYGQTPVVGEINFYGLHKITPERILSTLKVHPGNPIPPSKGDMEDRIGEMPGVILAHVEAVCCEGDRAALFIGIEERGAAHAVFRSEPNGTVALPADLVESYQNFLGAVQRAAERGAASEDYSAGHPMMNDPEARGFQQQFGSFAADHLEQLRSVLRTGADPDQRAMAATVIGYVPRKQDAINDLQYAVQDPEPAVRANAIRALTAFAVLASKQPNLGIRISPTWFIELLNSVELSDRMESTRALLTLTDRGAPDNLTLIRDRGLPALTEMSRWKTDAYALPSYLLIGRLGGVTEDEMQAAWSKGNREAELQKALTAANAYIAAKKK